MYSATPISALTESLLLRPKDMKKAQSDASTKVSPAPTEADLRLIEAAQEILAHHRGEVVLETRKVHKPQ